ncbi:MAG: rhomboid family intramembrane serine protease [Bdellovibrionales bacterium]
MIIPILNGLLSWRKAPVVWMLVALNLAVLGYTTSVGIEAQQGLEDLMKGSYFLDSQGKIYAQYLTGKSKSQYPPFMLELADKINAGEADRASWLGQLAFRDYSFMHSADKATFHGDQVALRYWKRRVGEAQDLQASHPSFTLGLNADDAGLEKWVSYIFVHSGMVHLAGNMLFLIIFGATLEMQIGGLGLLVCFLLSGVFAAGVFALMTGVTSSPLVGASGAVSGIMALYCVLNWSRPERYFYWFFLPFRGFMGFVFLPAWVALILWGINDLSGYLGTLPELGGVAYTAHLGGELSGVIVALTLWLVRRRKWPIVDRPVVNVPVGKLFPLLPPLPTRKPPSDRAA